MNATASRPHISRPVKSRRGQALAAIGALAGDRRLRARRADRARRAAAFAEPVTPTTAVAWPGKLTAAERAAVVAALSSRDAGTRRQAEQVAEGRAGALALADPAILHHHGVDTSAAAQPHPAAGAADRFHHR